LGAWGGGGGGGGESHPNFLHNFHKFSFLVMNHFCRLSLPQVYDGEVSPYGFILFYYISILNLFKGSLTRDFQLHVCFHKSVFPGPLSIPFGQF
jgi:hypothetical protein